MTTLLWTEQNGQLHSTPLTDMVWLDVDGQMHTQCQGERVGVGPVASDDSAVAVLIIPDNLQGVVTRNGLPLAAGLAVSRHAEEFAIHGRPFWTSAASQPEETEYSVTRHPADALCFLTKARLREGERITICPGRPGHACGTMYKRAAWETMLAQSPRFRCPNCAFDPRAPAWQPPPRRPRPSLAGVLSLLNRGRTP